MAQVRLLTISGATHQRASETGDGAQLGFFLLSDGGTAAYIQAAAGQGAAVSAADTGRLRYNATTQRWQVSANAGAYADIATGSGASTSNEATNTATTTDATVTTITTITLVANKGYWTKALVRGEVEGGTKRCLFEITAASHRLGAGAVLGQEVVVASWNLDGMNVAFSVSGNDLLLRVTGLASTTIKWTATTWYNASS